MPLTLTVSCSLPTSCNCFKFYKYIFADTSNLQQQYQSHFHSWQIVGHSWMFLEHHLGGWNVSLSFFYAVYYQFRLVLIYFSSLQVHSIVVFCCICQYFLGMSRLEPLLLSTLFEDRVGFVDILNFCFIQVYLQTDFVLHMAQFLMIIVTSSVEPKSSRWCSNHHGSRLQLIIVQFVIQSVPINNKTIIVI